MRSTHHSFDEHPVDAAIGSLGTILGLWAHPDDETYLAGGLMAAAVDRGQRVVTVSATAGEQGGPPGVDLARQRRRELREAMRRLGVREQTVLTYPDGGCADVDQIAGIQSFVSVIERVRPDTVVTFGPDGMTGHPDHRAVSAWATGAWQATGRRARLLYAATTPEFAERNHDVNVQISAFEPGLPRVTPADEITLRFVLDGMTLARKVTALWAHRSQTRRIEQIIGAPRFARWWDEECFVAVEPSATPPVGTLATTITECATVS